MNAIVRKQPPPSRRRSEVLAHAIAYAIHEADKRGLAVTRFPSSRRREVLASVQNISGKSCKVYTTMTVQKDRGQERLFVQMGRAQIADIDAAIVVLLAPEAYERILIIPTVDIRRECVAGESSSYRLTFPLHRESHKGPARRYDWWKYENNWEFFSTPRL